MTLTLLNRTLRVTIRSENGIPFECQWTVVTSDSTAVTGVPLEWTPVYPTIAKRVFYSERELQPDRVKGGHLEFRFSYRAFSAAELDLPGLSGSITKRYVLSADGLELRATPR